MAMTEELEEIDPVTGQALESTALSQAASCAPPAVQLLIACCCILPPRLAVDVVIRKRFNILDLHGRESVTAGGFKWAYRQAAPASAAKETPLLLLHGLGSSSYSYRYTPAVCKTRLPM